MSHRGTKLQYVTESDGPWIVEFLDRNFYRDEPITDYMKICENPSSLAELAKFSTRNLNQNLSYAALDETDKVVGVCINSVHSKDDPETTVGDPLFGVITKFLDYGFEEAKVFEKYPDIDRVLYIDILSVDKSAAGKGIGTFLVGHARINADARDLFQNVVLS